MADFEHFLQTNYPTKAEELSFLLENTKVKHFKKGEFLVQQCDVINFAYYIESGLFKQFVLSDEGKESIILFRRDNRFENNLDFLLATQKAADFNIQAIEDSTVHILSHAAFKKVYEENMEFALANNRLLQMHISCARDRVTQFLTDNAEKRYATFLYKYSDIAHRLPVGLIAAYIGITRESLSRLRSDWANDKNKK